MEEARPMLVERTKGRTLELVPSRLTGLENEERVKRGGAQNVIYPARAGAWGHREQKQTWPLPSKGFTVVCVEGGEMGGHQKGTKGRSEIGAPRTISGTPKMQSKM